MKTFISLLLIFLHANACLSQNASEEIFHLDKLPPEGILLNKYWKFHEGDNPDWAKIDYADKDWVLVNPALPLYQLPLVKENEIGWFRLTLKVDSSLKNKIIGIVLSFGGAAEIYLNGKLFYRFGAVSKDYNTEQTRILRNRPFSLNLGDQTIQTLAIRFSHNKNNLYVNFGSPVSCMRVVLKEIDTAFNYYIKEEGFYSTLRSIQMSLYFPLGILLFFFYFSIQRQKEFLYMGIFCFCFFLGMLLYNIGLAPSDTLTDSLGAIYVFSAHILWLSGTLFLLNSIFILLKKPKTLFFYFLNVYAFAAITSLLFFPSWAYIFETFFFPLTNIEFMRLYIQAIRKRRPGIWIPLGTVLLSVLGVIINTCLLILNQTEAAIYVLTIVFAIPSLGFSLFVAGEFARSASSLQLRMVEVEDLSAKTIAQEKEKVEAIIEKQHAIENIRSKISMDIHDEIGSRLTKISLLSQRIKLGFEKKKNIDPDIIEKITESSKEIIGNLGEIIWTVNPKHDNLPSLAAYLRNYITTFFEHSTIHYTIDFPDEIIAIVIPPDLKHNLFLVIKESLNNIVKHAQATEVNIHFHFTEHIYRFEIIDNGVGIKEMGGRDFGNGLLNMRSRMEAVNGKFEIVSEMSKGTKIILKGQFYS